DACMFKVIVLDTEAPTLACPAKITSNAAPGACSAAVNYITPAGADNCPGQTVSCAPTNGATFAKGTNSVSCTATDASGNTSDACMFKVVVLDNEAPTLACPADITSNTAPGACSAAVNYTTPAGADNCPGQTVSCAPTNGASFAKGTNSVSCTATDASRNSPTRRSSNLVVLDTEAPTLACPADITSNAAPGACSAAVNYITPAGADNCPGQTVSCAPTNGATFAKGTNSVSCTATDASGNTSDACMFKVVVLDNEAPTLACPADITSNTAPGACSAAVNYTTPAGADNCPGQTVSCAPTNGASFAKGTNSVSCTATDASRNSPTRRSSNLVVLDTEAPTLACPADITSNAAPGACSAAVNYITPAGADNCPGQTVSCAPTNGATFAKGTNSVSCTATDASGNTSDACMFKVVVLDNEAPTLACPADITSNTAPGACSAAVNYITPAGSDNCPGQTVSCAPTNGATFAKGTNSVSCTATDASGNTSDACMFKVIVLDSEAPTLACPA